MARVTAARLLAVGLLARLIAAVAVGGTTFRFVDEAIYVDGAAALRSGAALEGPAAHVPLYPTFLALLGILLPDGVLAFRLGQACVAAAGVLLCYALGRRLGGETAGLVAGALYALDPLLVVTAGLLYPEATAALLLAGGLLAAWSAAGGGRLFPFLSGALLGAATLFRPVTLAVAPAVAAWLLFAPAHPWSRRIAGTILFALAWGLVISPWVSRTHDRSGLLLPVEAPGLRGTPADDSLGTGDGIMRTLLSTAARDPAGFIGRTVREFGHFWELYPTRLVTDRTVYRKQFAEQDPRLSSAPVVRRSLRDVVSALSFGLELLLAAIGIAVGWRRQRRTTVWLMAVVLSFALGYALFHGKLRYRIPVLPVVLAFAGVGLTAVVPAWRQGQAGAADGALVARSHQ